MKVRVPEVKYKRWTQARGEAQGKGEGSKGKGKSKGKAAQAKAVFEDESSRASAVVASPSMWAFAALDLSESVCHSCRVFLAFDRPHIDMNGVSDGDIL